MICIRCQHDSKYPDRKATGTCEKCGGKFAFEPREGAKLSDQAFQKAIDKVSSDGKVKFGVEHLYYELCRRNRSKSKVLLGCVTFFFPMFIVTVLTLAKVVPVEVLMAGIVLSAVAAYFASRPSEEVSLHRSEFEKMWDRWGQIHGKVPSAIQRKPQDAPSRATRPAEPDLEDYSFDRAVICDRARTADLLLANNFHFENNCAILSFDGYPKPAFESVRRMLKRNPRLEVYALHDATPVGCRLAHRLATDPEWFKGQGRVIDVGLRPVHARPFDGLLLPGEGVVQRGNGISEEEARWLSEHRLELAAIRPEQVLKRLFKAISKQPSFPSATPEFTPSSSSRLDPALAAAGAIAVAGAAMAAPPPPGAKQQKPKDDSSSSSGSSSGGDSGGGDWSLDVDSFSSDADSSDGGADSFG
ncbi:hypothetical protein [Archangium sp.]|uniref:hypothetical protein n=1 Tax=Archangium sp. TaxID=1872627 RepID=UPI00286CB07C|nr:hypothetical protein [Archangium sp.]